VIKAIIFDFDGVLLESADIKTRAFAKLFEKDHSDKLTSIIAYHMENMGISRYIKFRYIFEKILKMPLTVEEENRLGEEFSAIVINEVLAAPFVPGALEFLQKYYKEYLFFVASGTPEEELDCIIEKRELNGYFVEVHGTPRKKADIIADILDRHNLIPLEVLFVGDAESDLIAAQTTRVHFIARIHGNGNDLNECKYKVADLSELVHITDHL